MKPWYKSLTFWSLIVSLIGLVLSGLGGGKSPVDILGDPDVQATLGEILATIGFGGVLIGRVRAQGPLTMGKKDQGFVDMIGLLMIATSAAVAVIIASCASTETVSNDPFTIEYWDGPPCRIHVLQGDRVEPVAIFRNPKGSPLRCATRSSP